MLRRSHSTQPLGLLLVDASRFPVPSSRARVLLCWAWRHAFPEVPEAVVREIAGLLPPGELDDELLQLRRLLDTSIDIFGCEAHCAVVLCNAERLPAQLAAASPCARAALLTADERAAAATEGEAAADSSVGSGVVPSSKRLRAEHAAASRCLLAARRRFQEEADAICDELHARSVRAHRGTDALLIATAAPQARVLVAPDLSMGGLASGRRGSNIFFHELTFLACRRLPPHRTAFQAFRAVAARSVPEVVDEAPGPSL